MSIENSFRATFQIVNLSVGSGGSGVAVWRDTGNNNLYIASAYHVVEDMKQGLFIDYTGKKYTEFNFIVLDKTYDFALIELKGVSTLIRPVSIQNYISKIPLGADVYVIGWPLLMDNNSISSGTVRSTNWNMNGIINQILISAPIFGGNSGGGVFIKETHQLIGVVSWGIKNNETINGVVPFNIILEALYSFIYNPNLITPSPINSESYIFGVSGILIDPFHMNYNLNPTLPQLSQFGSAGMIVLSVLPSSPAANVGFTNVVNNNNKYSYDIIWGIKPINISNYVFINEERSLDSIIYLMYRTTQHVNRRLLPTRSKGEPINNALNINLPNTLIIDCLVSRVINNVHDNKFINKRITLIKRNNYYQINNGDSSTFGNEFMFGIRNTIDRQIQQKDISLKDYGTNCLELIHKNLIVEKE